jgi:hydrogenase maturation protease
MPDAVVIGVGNRLRRDDGVGPAVAAVCAARDMTGVRVITEMADPTDLLDAWSGAGLAVLVDAVVSGTAAPGTVRCWRPDDLGHSPAVSSHGMDVAAMIRLGRVLDRLPAEVVLISVEAADTGHGPGLTERVAAAVPVAVEAVASAISTRV